MNKIWMTAASIVLLASLLSACGGSDDAPPSAGGSGVLPGATASGSVARGASLGDCEYAAALVRSMERFTGAVPSFGTPAVAGKDAVIRSLNTFDGELAALVGELRGYRLASDVARVNDGVVSIFEDARKQLPDVKNAVESGDAAKLTVVAAKLTGEVFPRLDTIQADNKGVMDRLNRCGRSQDRSRIAALHA